MAEIVQFTPKRHLTALQNLKAFIEASRNQLAIFGADLPFDDDIWDISDSSARRGMSHRQRITFSTLATASKSKPTMMAEPFKSFAKAYVRYMQGLRPTKNPQPRLGALRALEQALAENGSLPHPEATENQVLNRAAQIAKSHFKSGVAYRVGQQLQVLSDFMSKSRLTAIPLDWKNPIARPGYTNRVDEQGKKRREELMPSAEALRAVATAFLTAEHPADVIVVSAAALMCGAPDRISEVLAMPAVCEVSEPRQGADPAYGLRWSPSKGAEERWPRKFGQDVKLFPSLRRTGTDG